MRRVVSRRVCRLACSASSRLCFSSESKFACNQPDHSSVSCSQHRCHFIKVCRMAVSSQLTWISQRACCCIEIDAACGTLTTSHTHSSCSHENASQTPEVARLKAKYLWSGIVDMQALPCGLTWLEAVLMRQLCVCVETRDESWR